MIRLTDGAGRLVLSSTTYPMHKYEKLKESLGKYDKKRNVWTFPVLYCCVADILSAFPDVEIESSLVKEIMVNPDGSAYDNAPVYGTQNEYYDELYQFQKDAVAYILNHPYGNMILALSPGLGKTATALVAAQEKGAKRIVVVCPEILIPTWLQEIEKWSDYTAHNAHQKPPSFTAHINVVNYESLRKYAETYANMRLDILIVDESIMIKTLRVYKKNSSQRALNVFKVAEESMLVWLLS